ncbi:GTP-binding protein [Pisolithus marmoratus]|nr:GTP-binding protein [Pisolithus marmoratus]
MTFGCFSGFWCCQQPPSPSDDVIETLPMPPSSRPPIHLDPAEAKQHIARIERFRILVMGRANAGKTTILQRVCNTTDQPEILNGQGQKVDAAVVQGSLMRGNHHIEDELVFTSNPGFVFHDSCGFEAGSEEEFQTMKEFVMDRAKTTRLDKRIHAIWFCIPLHDRHRMVTAAEMKFFDACDTGHVPVIVLLTKADTLSLDAWEEVEEQRENGLSVDNVMQYMTEIQGGLLNSALRKVKEMVNKQRFTPHDYITLGGMDKEGADCTSLITCTANAWNEEGLQQLLISTQQSNLELCMEFAVMK